MININTLATCKNRFDLTCKSLESLHNQRNQGKLFNFKHFLVDDKSSDGTYEKVKNLYPNVTLIRGSGNLYWAGGMRLGWSFISKSTNFDYLFVYNDDVIFNLNAITLLLKSLDNQNKIRQNNVILIGDIEDPISKKINYGGLVRNSIFNPLSFKIDDRYSDQLLDIKTINMNGCLIGKRVLKKFGFLDKNFTHGGADFEYGLRVGKNKNFFVLRLSKVIGQCKRNDIIPLNGSLVEKWKTLNSPKFQPMRQRVKFYKKYGGIFWVIYCFRYYLKIFFK